MILLLFFTLSGRIKHIELRTAGAGVCFGRQWIIGKQVKSLYDLVTVSKEPMVYVKDSH